MLRSLAEREGRAEIPRECEKLRRRSAVARIRNVEIGVLRLVADVEHLHAVRAPKDTQHRQVKCLNNVVEADHGKLRHMIGLVRGFKRLKTAYATIRL